MNVLIIAVDKLRERYVREGCALYVKRLSPLVPVSVEEVKSGTMETEARAILKRVPEHAALWALDREGSSLSSVELSRRFADVQRSGRNILAIAIGGPEGLHASVLRRAEFRWSLSALTLLHEMARLVALEQLYRALKIARGEPYHR